MESDATIDFYNSRYFSINQKLLRFLGIWPYQNKLMKILIQITFTTLMLISILPQFIAIREHAGVENDKVVQAVATIFYFFGVCLKFLASITFEKKIQIVYEKIVENWNLVNDAKEKEKLLEHSENGRFLTIGYATYMFTALITFVTMPVLPFIIDIVLPINGSRQKIYILDGEFMVDRNDYYFEIYIFEACTCIATVFVFSAIDSTYSVCVEHCIGLLAIVKLRLQLATKQRKKFYYCSNQTNDESYGAIIKSIDLHQKVIDFAALLESSYSTSFLIVMGCNVMVLSSGAIVVLTNLERPMQLLRYIMIMIGLAIHMFYVSLPGQKLIDSSGDLFYDAYNSEWYKCSDKSKNLLRFLMLRCKDPCQLTAGGLYTMNFENFGALTKSTMSYITVFASFR